MDAAIDAPGGRTHAKFTGAVLRDLQVRVELETIRQPQPPDETSLYSAAMLQLVNGLAANGDAVDLRQRSLLGRSVYGGHRRIGSRYCSSNCPGAICA